MQCHIKTYCQGIHCQCCEELRCFSHQESLSLESETPNNGILVVQNCTDAFTPNLYQTYCQGIHCQCCEELRCFSHQESLSLESEIPKNGSLVVQNCTDAFTPNLYQTYCQGLTWCDRVIFTSQFFSAQDVSKLFNLIYKKNYNLCKESKSYKNLHSLSIT